MSDRGQSLGQAVVSRHPLLPAAALAGLALALWIITTDRKVAQPTNTNVAQDEADDRPVCGRAAILLWQEVLPRQPVRDGTQRSGPTQRLIAA